MPVPYHYFRCGDLALHVMPLPDGGQRTLVRVLQYPAQDAHSWYRVEMVAVPSRCFWCPPERLRDAPLYHLEVVV